MCLCEHPPVPVSDTSLLAVWLPRVSATDAGGPAAQRHRLQAEARAGRDGRGRHADPRGGQLRHHPDRRRRQERLQCGCKLVSGAAGRVGPPGQGAARLLVWLWRRRRRLWWRWWECMWWRAVQGDREGHVWCCVRGAAYVGRPWMGFSVSLLWVSLFCRKLCWRLFVSVRALLCTVRGICGCSLCAVW